SFHFDIPSSPRPPAKPPDDDETEPNSGIVTVKVVGDNSEHYVHMPRLLPTQPTLASNQEKSPHLLSHQGHKSFQLSSESPMMIYGGNIPILDVPFSISIPLDQLKYGGNRVKLSDLKQALRIFWILKTRAHGFVLRSPDLRILNFILGILYPNLID
nr:hypothetical protein [Tanacetum cinerariifolium]